MIKNNKKKKNAETTGASLLPNMRAAGRSLLTLLPLGVIERLPSGHITLKQRRFNVDSTS